jgi:pimeloyl-ACP methyl ester carboxylesterase
MTLEAAPLQRLVVTEGVELHAALGGQGEPLVFIHGVMGDWRSWSNQWPAFVARFRCCSYSRRYNHPNGNRMPSPHHSAVVEAQDLLGLIDTLGWERVTLVGSSYGAFVALALAVTHPQRVRAIVASEPAMLCYAEFSAQGRSTLEAFRRDVVEPANAAFRAGDDLLGARLMTGGIQGSGRAVTDPATPTPASGQARAQAMARREQNVHAMRMLALSSNEFPLLAPASLAALPMPVLLLRGEHTPAIHAEVFHNVAAAMPQAAVQTIAGSGHSVPQDQPAAFNAAALAFLDTHGVAKSTDDGKAASGGNTAAGTMPG